MKVIGIGLNKTGTKTLGTCLTYWGLRHTTYSHQAFDLWRKRDYASLMQWINLYDSFEDWPWPLIYRQIDQAFPGTKFILTTRKDAETWYQSLCNHALRTGPTHFRKYIYGYAMPQENRAQHIRFYEQHNQSVREYFKDRPNDIIEICWERGDGWEQLSEFLGLPLPDIPLPHANKTPEQFKQGNPGSG